MITLKVWIVKSAQGKERSLVKIGFLLDYLPNSPATRDFFKARKVNVNLRVIMVSYGTKGFILGLVLHVHIGKFLLPRTHLFFTAEVLLQCLCRPDPLSTKNTTFLLYKHYNYVFLMRFSPESLEQHCSTKDYFFPSNYLNMCVLVFSCFQSTF